MYTPACNISLCGAVFFSREFPIAFCASFDSLFLFRHTGGVLRVVYFIYRAKKVFFFYFFFGVFGGHCRRTVRRINLIRLRFFLHSHVSLTSNRFGLREHSRTRLCAWRANTFGMTIPFEFACFGGCELLKCTFALLSLFIHIVHVF